MRREQIPALTGLRFFAALLVVADHYWQPTMGGLPIVVRNVAASGYQGVSFFFILSGFVLTYTYAPAGGDGRGAARAFWWARFARIYPMYLVALILALLTAPHGGVRSALLVQAWVPDVAHDPNGPGWSISAEACFYAAFPLLIRRVAPLGTRALWFVAGWCWAALLGASALYLAIHPDAGAWDSGWMQALTFNPLSRLPEFVLGIALCRLYQAGAVPRIPTIAAGAAVIAACMAAPLLPYALTGHGLFDPLFAALIVAATRGAAPLGGRAMVLLGDASYSLYLLQAPVWALLCAFLGVSAASASRSGALVAVFTAILVCCALLAHRAVEVPARAWVRHMVRQG